MSDLSLYATTLIQTAYVCWLSGHTQMARWFATRSGQFIRLCLLTQFPGSGFTPRGQTSTVQFPSDVSLLTDDMPRRSAPNTRPRTPWKPPPLALIGLQRTDRQTGSQAGRQTDRRVDRQTDRQTGQTDRQTDGQTGRKMTNETDKIDQHTERGVVECASDYCTLASFSKCFAISYHHKQELPVRGVQQPTCIV